MAVTILKVEKQSIYYEKLSIENKLSNDKFAQTSKYQRGAVLIAIIVLMIISVANMISTTFYDSVSSGKDILFSMQNSTKHIMWMVIGLMFLVATFIIPYNLYQKKKVRKFIALSAVVVLIGILIGSKVAPGIVPVINGAIGWIRVGPFTIQPSEFFKVSYIIILAHLLEVATKKKLETKSLLGVIAPVAGLFCGLVYAQGDLGTTIHYLVITACMLLVSPISSLLIKAILTAGPLAFISLMSFFYFQDVGGGYRLRRISSYVDILLKGNERDMGVGYQVIQSLIAMGNGGIVGRGYGNGIQKYNYLPEIHTDFISSSLAEEWGFLMMVAIILIFLFIQKIAINTAVNAQTYFGKYLVIGLGSLIFTQMLMNLYVATGLMPVTGLPLPLFSYGGSSTITTFIALGIILNVNKKNVKDKCSK